jgi:hypothetical protein
MKTHIKLQRYGSPARITESRARGVLGAPASLQVQAQPGTSDTERAWDQGGRSLTAVDSRCPPDPVQDTCMVDPGPRNKLLPDGGCAGAISAARRSQPGSAVRHAGRGFGSSVTLNLRLRSWVYCAMIVMLRLGRQPCALMLSESHKTSRSPVMHNDGMQVGRTGWS